MRELEKHQKIQQSSTNYYFKHTDKVLCAAEVCVLRFASVPFVSDVVVRKTLAGPATGRWGLSLLDQNPSDPGRHAAA